jgi:hypothetical protein
LLTFLYSNIDSPSTALGRRIDHYALKTGWAWTILGVGPNPRAGGEIEVVRYIFFPIAPQMYLISNSSYHNGQTAAGNKFSQFHPEYCDAVIAPFLEFGRAVFRASLQTI